MGIALFLYGIALMAITVVLVWCATVRWLHVGAIAVLSMLLYPLVARWVIGDVSALLPQKTFSDGVQGKDEIVIASAYATITLAIAMAALLLWAIKKAWRFAKGWNPSLQND